MRPAEGCFACVSFGITTELHVTPQRVVPTIPSTPQPPPHHPTSPPFPLTAFAITLSNAAIWNAFLPIIALFTNPLSPPSSHPCYSAVSTTLSSFPTTPTHTRPCRESPGSSACRGRFAGGRSAWVRDLRREIGGSGWGLATVWGM